MARKPDPLVGGWTTGGGGSVGGTTTGGGSTGGTTTGGGSTGGGSTGGVVPQCSPHILQHFA
ncbi:hypothetical protein CO111_06375 [Candidatus Desantisbacteria bacterium CG_4_9_14_3_um_filter_50_7]|nr:MAG: hypothetical protein CO111_06375 [Candidatus Desantisbacteria bacterium CG_4_9_14_3_um_filter_50_7]